MNELVSFVRRLSLRTWLALAAAVVVIVVIGFFLSGSSEPGTPPKTEQAAAAPGEAAIGPETARASGITIETAGPTSIRETLTLYGSIKPNAEREQELRARYPGVVRLVSKRPGEAVGRGETLVTVESNESLQTYGIKSPIAGSVLERHVNPGESVSSDAVLLKVADLSTVWAEFAVFTRDLGRVRGGLAVNVSGSDHAQSTDGVVAYVAPAGDSDSQSVAARAVLDNAGGRWIPGQFVVGEVVISEVKAAVAVRPSALQSINGKTVVFVQTPRGFTAREVTTGQRSHDAVEIIRGMSAGERYAATNSYLVKADLLKGEAGED